MLPRAQYPTGHSHYLTSRGSPRGLARPCGPPAQSPSRLTAAAKKGGGGGDKKGPKKGLLAGLEKKIAEQKAAQQHQEEQASSSDALTWPTGDPELRAFLFFVVNSYWKHTKRCGTCSMAGRGEGGDGRHACLSVCVTVCVCVCVEPCRPQNPVHA